MIVINLNKAKIVAHEIRRTARSAEFEPFDSIISKQIPGASAQDAEAKRQEIREKYEAMQVAIDASSTIVEIKAIVTASETI